MTTQTAIIYLKFLINLFQGKKIGLIWDKHSSHYSEDVLRLIDNNNKDNNKKATIISALVDEGLTPIIQVPDVAVNKIFKLGLKQRYYSHWAEVQIEVWTKLKITKEKIIEFIFETINDINTESE